MAIDKIVLGFTQSALRGVSKQAAIKGLRNTSGTIPDFLKHFTDRNSLDSFSSLDSPAQTLMYKYKPRKEWLIHIKDLIKPEELKNLKEWDDYVLLIHNSFRTPLIKKDGLRCLTDINPELASSKRGIGFSNDPDLIYFRPKTPHSNFMIGEDSVVIAVPKKNVRVFNQEERVTQNFPFYCGHSMPVEEYDKLMSQIKPGEWLKGDKRIVPLEKVGRDRYIPEVCFDDKYISPDYFVSLYLQLI